MSRPTEYYTWTQDEAIRVSIPIRAAKRVAKTVAMREEYRKGEITKEEYRSYLNSGSFGEII